MLSEGNGSFDFSFFNVSRSFRSGFQTETDDPYPLVILLCSPGFSPLPTSSSLLELSDKVRSFGTSSRRVFFFV